MKMSLLVGMGILAGALTGFGQGFVDFSNIPSTFGDGIDRSVYGPDGVTRLTGQNWAAALYFGSQANTINQLAVLNATDTSLNSAKALFRVPTTMYPGTWVTGGRTLPGTQAGQQLWMQVRVWDITLFGDYASALAAGGITGRSDAFEYRVPNSPTPSPDQIRMYNLRSFILVPEPNTLPFLLGALGGLLGFRCRKRLGG